MIKEVNGWSYTDAECMQCCKKENDYEFKFIRAVWLDTCGDDERAKNAKNEHDNYAICAATINVNDYTEIEIETAVSSYGYSLDKLYEENYSNEIIAECLFEDNCLYDSCSISDVISWSDAEKIIQHYISEN